MTRTGAHAGRARGAACTGLVVLLIGSAAEPARAQVADARPASGPAHNLNPLSTLDPATLDAFKGRPLFAPSRRPPAPRQPIVALPEPVAVEAPPPDLRLIGVVAGVDNAVAILRRPAGGPSLSLKLGDSVETWRVKAIGPDRVTLSDAKREATYRMFTASPPGPRGALLPPIGVTPAR